jgi:hypothetical protein
MRTKVNLFEKHSLLHEKWLIKIKYKDFKYPIYVVWLTDTSDNSDDKMLTNSSGQIVGSKNFTTLINYIVTTRHKLFDSRQTKAWARKVNGIRPRLTATYDLDRINSLPKQIDQERLEEVSNFINLFTDLITTTKDKKLQRLRSKKDVKAIWEHYYNYVFWPRFNDVKKLKAFKVEPFKSNPQLKEILKKMIENFVQRVEIVQ